MATNIREINNSIVLLQRGNGVPNHISTRSTLFFDLDTPLVYINKDGAATWSYLLDSSMSITGGTSSGDTYVTGFTYDNANNLTLHRNDGINLSTNIHTFTGLTVTGLISAATISAITISATTFYGDGSHLTGISGSSGFDIYVTGGTPNNSTKSYIFTNTSGGTFNVTGLTDITITGGTYATGTATLTNNTGGTFNISGFYTNANDIYVTGGTFNNSTRNATFTNSTGGTFNVTNFNDTFITGATGNDSLKTYTFTNSTGGTIIINALSDIRVTGGTYSNGIAIFTNNTGGTFSISGFVTGDTNTFVTGGTPNNSTKQYVFTNSTGGTFNVLGLIDITITGGTYSNGIATLTNSTGGTFNISGFNTTIDTNTYVTGGTPNNSTKSYVFTNSTGGTFSVLGLTDITITGGTPNDSTKQYTFTNSTGGTFNILGLTDINVTGTTFNNNLLSINNNTGGTSSVLINTFSGLTINGNLNTITLSATSISANTYYNIPDTTGISVDGQGGVLTTGIAGYKVMSTTGRIIGWDLVSSVSGSVVFDIWKVPSGSTLPTITNTITGGNYPQLNNTVYSGSTNMIGWTTSINIGDIVGYNINSASSVIKASLSLRILKQ